MHTDPGAADSVCPGTLDREPPLACMVREESSYRGGQGEFLGRYSLPPRAAGIDCPSLGCAHLQWVRKQLPLAILEVDVGRREGKSVYLIGISLAEGPVSKRVSPDSADWF